MAAPTQPIHKRETANTPGAGHSTIRFVKSGGCSINIDEQRQDGSIGIREAVPRNTETPCKRYEEMRQQGGMDVQSPTFSPFEMHPVVFSTHDSLVERPARLDSKRNSLCSPQLSQAIHHSRRHTTNSTQLEKSGELLKLLETSTVTTEDSLTPDDTSDPTKAIRPTFPLRDEIMGHRSSSLKALSGGAHKASAEEINGKIREMLAAMEALKPATPLKSQGSRKLSRVTNSKVFARMSDAFGRIYSKSASPEAMTTDQERNSRLGNTGMPLTRSLSPAKVSQYSIRSIEIRLNEGTNLNRSKVQQMVGNRVFRKPVASQGNSFLCRRVDDHFNDQESTPSIEEYRLKRQSFLSPINPFETEENFEHNLENGILDVSPAGSSTPRNGMRRASGSSFGDASLGDLSGSSIGQVDLARIMVKVGTKDDGSPQIRKLNLQSPTEVPRPWQSLKRGRDVQHDDFAKKHPSPSKRDLEALELAFQQYTIPNGPPADEDADELAGSDMLLGVALTDKDPNRRLLKQDAKGEGTSSQQRVTSKTFPSRIPLPRGQLGMSEGSKIRLARDFIPKNAVPGELDELL